MILRKVLIILFVLFAIVEARSQTVIVNRNFNPTVDACSDASNIVIVETNSSFTTGAWYRCVTGAYVSVDLNSAIANEVTSVFGRSGVVTAQSNDYTFAQLASKPTTIAGYGITDFNSLGDARWSLLGHTHTFASITSPPTTLNGYGITAQGARVYNSANQAVSSGGGGLTVLFDSERFDTNNFHSTGSNTGRLTFATAGVYQITFQGRLAGSAVGQRECDIVLNGTTIIGMTNLPLTGSTNPYGFQCSTIYKMSASDFVTVIVFQDSGSALDLRGNDLGNFGAEFSAIYLGL